MPTFPVPVAAVLDRKPEGAEHVVFVAHTTRGHDDCRDRVVYDFLLRGDRHAPPVTLPPQLSDQLGSTLMQLRRRRLRRPAPVTAPRPAHVRSPRPPAQGQSPPYRRYRLQLIHE